MVKNDKNYQNYIKNCVAFCKTANLTTKKAIYAWLKDDLQKTYTNTPIWKIEKAAEKITESICYQMGIRR